MKTAETLKSLVGCLQHGADAKTVFGDPISVEGRTLIPVAKVGYGWGGGLHPKQADLTKQKTAEPRLGFAQASAPNRSVCLRCPKRGPSSFPSASARKILAALAAGLIVGLILGRRR